MTIGIIRWDDRVDVVRWFVLHLDGEGCIRCCPRALPHFRPKPLRVPMCFL